MKKYKLNILSVVKIIIILSVVFIGTTTVNAALLVSNVVAVQKTAVTKKPVEITYDLYGAPAGVHISVKISTNLTDSYVLDPATLSGDAGLGITTGTGKKITWTSVDDWSTSIYHNVKFEIIAFDGKNSADPDIIMKPVGIGIIDGKVTDTLEWDLQSFTYADNLQYSPLWCKNTKVTAAQYCRFMNAYKDRFSDKYNPSCATTSVFNNAQGGAWVYVTNSLQLCIIRSTPESFANNTYSKIKWDTGNNRYQFNVSDWHTNQPMTEVSWYGAVAYCMWLNEVEFGSDTTKWKYRLPTEFEYEFMMGAKTFAASNGKQDWGSAAWTYGMQHDTASHTHNSNDWINYYQDSPYGLHAVGTKPEADQNKGYGNIATNVFECYEMSGNVWSWTLDTTGYGGTISGKNWVNRDESSSRRRVRGGGWGNAASDCVTSKSAYSEAAALNNDCGFVVVRDR